ncbi:MAG TPA: signal peptidase I [Vicinamibacterales bacterium]|nr:signal peptidase I [Vicinamibacterales bacterium]
MTWLLGRSARATLTRATVMVIVAYVLFGFFLLPVRLSGISMEPTYRDGQINFANRLAYLRHEPARGDVVAIRMAGPNVVYVKRVVALPGERVEIAMGVVVVNGQPLVEPAVVNRAPWNLPAVTLGAREYFVIGDNRAMRMEDHDFGRADRGRIIGKMLF